MFDERLKSLPVPTPGQTARFADHVATNHSWYKHLPFFPPGAAFAVFPNPQAGRGVRAEGERFEVFDIGEGSYFTHHSRLSTADYLAWFGHWDYWVVDNPRRARDPDPDPGPWLYSPDGGRERLADDLLRLGTCRLTAFVFAVPHMLRLEATTLQQEADAFTAANRHSLWHRLLGRLGGPQEDSSIRRYREVAPALRRAAGTLGDASLHAFMESERQAQREVLLGTLHRVRAAWAGEGEGEGVHPPAFDPRWRSETVVALANGIFADGAFDRLPVLADALEDAGCDDTSLLPSAATRT